MKYETLMLRGLFIACMLVCTLVLGEMLTITPSSVQLAATGSLSSAILVAPAQCVLPADGVLCPLPRG